MTFNVLTIALLASNALANPIIRGPGRTVLSSPSVGNFRRSYNSRPALVDDNDIFIRSKRSLGPEDLNEDIIIRAVDELDEAATEEAHTRDETATRAFSDIKITTSDGKCLSVDKLSGDFRANLTPVQMVDCDTTDGEGWDIITSGVHNDREGAMLVVSTLTQACLNFDPRRVAGDQVNLFSCGGRAAGEGEVTDSQLFAFTEGETSLSLKPVNGQEQQCLTGTGERVDIAACDDGAADQVFEFGTAAGDDGQGEGEAGEDDEEEEEGEDDECVADDDEDEDEEEPAEPTPTPPV